jgi:hypothetical protein
VLIEKLVLHNKQVLILLQDKQEETLHSIHVPLIKLLPKMQLIHTLAMRHAAQEVKLQGTQRP